MVDPVVTPAPLPPAFPNWGGYVALLGTLAAIVGFGGTYSYVWASVDIALFAALAGLLWQRAWHGHILAPSLLLVPMLGFGALLAAQWACGWSVYPGATLTGIIQVAGCGCCFYLILCAGQRAAMIRRAAYVLWLFCAALSIEALLQYFGANGYIYWFHDATYAQPVGPFVYHNHFAGCLELLLPLAVAMAFRRRGPDPEWISWLRGGLVPVLAVAALVISRSRGGILVVGAELLLAVAVFWPELRTQRRSRHILAISLVTAMVIGVFSNWGLLAQGFFKLSSHDVSSLERLELARACFSIFWAHPWVGSGFNTFASIYPAFQTYENGLSVLYAHNDMAQVVAETGIAGAICVVTFIAIWALAFWRRRQARLSSGSLRNLQLAAFIGTAGFMVHSLGDFMFHSPADALLFFFLLGVAVAPAYESRSGKSRHQRRRVLRAQANQAASPSLAP